MQIVCNTFNKDNCFLFIEVLCLYRCNPWRGLHSELKLPTVLGLELSQMFPGTLRQVLPAQTRRRVLYRPGAISQGCQALLALLLFMFLAIT